jgi:CcmD family protein
MQIPDTAFYMYLGYGVIFTVLGIYLVSLNQRLKNAKHTFETLKVLEADQENSAQ